MRRSENVGFIVNTTLGLSPKDLVVAVGTTLSTLGVGPPPARIPAGAASALGSYLGSWHRSAPAARGACCGFEGGTSESASASSPSSVGFAGFDAEALDTSATARRS